MPLENLPELGYAMRKALAAEAGVPEKEVFYVRGARVVLTPPGRPLDLLIVGDLDKNILPTVRDLEHIRDVFWGLPDLVKAHPDVVFFPPILAHRVERGVDVFVLGDTEHGLWAGEEDIRNLLDLLKGATEHDRFVVISAARQGHEKEFADALEFAVAAHMVR